ncbi:hypothetical protein AB6E71_03690 [Staphylococcus arlettae]|uniref:hypothetical protein n=1 Tax=Staphylococcus TaxID=1279 RepID=UPI000390FF4F|nr:hypothetical protein [Staphylococcus sp. EGD-HP3]ERF49564.1 hypothetical protein N039_09745 [Staphylococcus sp. EGD-HP3]
MAQIKETDYHHGALTSVLVNNGYNLILWETHETRRSYKVSQNNEEFIIYSKYSSGPSSKRKNKSLTWSYTFTNTEIDKIRGYMKDSKRSHVALISKNANNIGGELVILNEEEFLKCIGDGWNGEYPYISVVKKKNCQLRVYGRGVSRDEAFIPKMSLID